MPYVLHRFMVLTGGLKITKKVLEFLGGEALGEPLDYNTRFHRPSVITRLCGMFSVVK